MKSSQALSLFIFGSILLFLIGMLGLYRLSINNRKLVEINMDDIKDNRGSLNVMIVELTRKIKQLEEKSDGLEFGILITNSRVDDYHPLAPKPKERSITIPKKKPNVKSKYKQYRRNCCH